MNILNVYAADKKHSKAVIKIRITFVLPYPQNYIARSTDMPIMTDTDRRPTHLIIIILIIISLESGQPRRCLGHTCPLPKHTMTRLGCYWVLKNTSVANYNNTNQGAVTWKHPLPPHWSKKTIEHSENTQPGNRPPPAPVMGIQAQVWCLKGPRYDSWSSLHYLSYPFFSELNYHWTLQASPWNVFMHHSRVENSPKAFCLMHK